MKSSPPTSATGRAARLLGTAATIVAALVLSACAGPQSSTSVGGDQAAGHLDVAIGYNNNSSWDPLNTGSAFSMSAENHVYEGLWDSSPIDRTPYAALATELPDTAATTWTVMLRDGATFHDGQPVTADDVVYSIDRVLADEPVIITHDFFANWLKGATKIDDRTVEITLNYAFPYAVDRFSILKIMPKHVFDGQSEDFFKSGANAVGSGPFKISGHEDTSFTSFERYEGYNGPLQPQVQSMRWNVSVDAAARTSLLTSGVSGVQISDNIPQDSIETLQGAGLEVQGVDSMNMLGLAFNTSKAPFDDVRVRQALRYAIDAQKLIDVSIAGKGTPSTSFLQDSSPYYSPAATQYAYNVDEAKRLLAEAGVTDLDVTLLSTNISWTQVAVNSIKEAWDAIGVNTTLDIQETAAFNTKVSDGADVDVLAFSGNPNQFGTDADLNVRWFYSTSNNFMRWNKWGESAEFQALEGQLDAAAKAPTKEESTTLMNQALDTIAEQAVIYPVMHMQLFTAWDPAKVSGVTALNIPGVYLMDATPTAAG